MPDLPLDGRVAIVTGANHGIGAATAAELARLGADVAVAYLAYTPGDHDPGRPAEYRAQREQGPDVTVAAVEAAGRRVHAVEADLADADAPGHVFAEAEMALGPVSILVNNASGWRKDTFSPDRDDVLGRDACERAPRRLLQQALVPNQPGQMLGPGPAAHGPQARPGAARENHRVQRCHDAHSHGS